MTDERALELFGIRMFFSNPKNEMYHYSHDEIKENIDAMKRIIQLNPILSREEQNFLQCVYKAAISSPRDILSRLQSDILAEDDSSLHLRTDLVPFPKNDLSPYVRERLIEFREKIKTEIVEICQDFMNLVETHLLSYASAPEDRVFYKKLLGDYSRYMFEAVKNEENQQKAYRYYKEALEISQDDLPPTHYLSLGLIVNYTVFLYDVMGRHDEAIDWAKRTLDEVSYLDDQLDNNALNYLGLIKENIGRWEEIRRLSFLSSFKS